MNFGSRLELSNDLRLASGEIMLSGPESGEVAN